MIGPQTLAQWLRGLRRRGVQCRLDETGHLRALGVKRKLSASERSALFASAPMVQQLLLWRRAKRRKKDEEQQHVVATAEPQSQRRVVGQIVQPGRPLRLLYADEVKPVPAHARVIGKVPYGWLIGGSDGD